MKFSNKMTVYTLVNKLIHNSHDIYFLSPIKEGEEPYGTNPVDKKYHKVCEWGDIDYAEVKQDLYPREIYMIVVGEEIIEIYLKEEKQNG